MNTPIRALLNQIRQATENTSEAEKGHGFEVLIKRFLETEPTYRERFSEVWLWSDWPCAKGRHDTGIDIVAREAATDGYVAVQCKCYTEDHLMNLRDLQTFFGAYNRNWVTESGDKISFESGLIIATTDRWNEVIIETIREQERPCRYLGLSDLENAPVDWEKLCKGQAGDIPKYEPKPHQREAIDAVMQGLQNADRGKLIMACGTGKTFTALRLTEAYTQGKGCVLFLAPSIALVAQSLREWMSQTVCSIHPITVCSDAGASRVDDLLDFSACNLASPATTNPDAIARNYARYRDRNLTVIFSTYQSLDKVWQAQCAGALPEFDLCICDEAHRTTGVSLFNTATSSTDESLFVRIHDSAYIKCRKRVYMTATPRVYTEDARRRAKDAKAEVVSMDDPEQYGQEFFRLPFSRAVREGLLTDYKVLVLCVDEDYVKDLFGDDLPTDDKGEVLLDDAVKMVGCYNGLRKKVLLPKSMRSRKSAESDDTEWDDIGEARGEGDAVRYDPTRSDNPLATHDFLTSDPQPMKRAVAFTGKIDDSRENTRLWKKMLEHIREHEGKEKSFLPGTMKHVDGTMDMNERQELLSWLKGADGNPEQECRILSNARCLSEGVDVPSLDAVMFMAPRRSKVDVVQSVGRVMRLAPGKKFGYIILPIGIPADANPEEVLDKDDKYAVVWDVLQALRSHDDRFNAEINSIELNHGRGERITVVGVTEGAESDGWGAGTGNPHPAPTQGDFFRKLFEKKLENWTDGILVRTVKKCGDRRYWEDWAVNIAKIAERQLKAIQSLLDRGVGVEEFKFFLAGLRENTNPAITEADAVEMLAQQFISRPVFNALFEKYRFAESNPVSQTMNRMLDIVQQNTDENDLRELRRFYDSVKDRARSIDNAAGRQQVVVELYDKFFKQAFPKMSEKLGIVYTPIPVVDFIVHSVHRVLQKEFGVKDGLGAQGVKILDPFTGTGTFIVRAIQSGLIKRSQLPYKYRHEMFACEIVLLAYYIACVNIEVAYHGVMQQQEYEPFSGICLTDTFRMEGNSAADKDLFDAFEDNGERVKKLCKQDIRVIIGNPPYSVGQKSANDNNQNEAYPYLDERIADTYAENSKATNKNSLYDSYIRAFRWASDKITDDGILAFVTNGSYIDNNAMSGFRQSLMGEFDTIYCFNLRGNQRTSGELSRKEGGKIFGSGSRTPVAIIILVKKKNRPAGQQATLRYYDIGDYLSREQKLKIIKDFGDYTAIPWQTLIPDKHGDWLNHRTSGYEKFLPIGDKATKGKPDTKAIFTLFSGGVKTGRDAWCYNYSRSALESNIRRSIDFFNTQSGLTEFDHDPTKFSWGRQQKKDAESGKQYCFSASSIVSSAYRPFCKRYGYIHRDMNDMVYQMPKLFPTPQHKNLVITIPGQGSSKTFSCLINSITPDLNILDAGGQNFPLYWYEKREQGAELELGLEADAGDYIRHDGITDFGLGQFRAAYGDSKIGKEDIFYYVYGLLHSTEYRTRFENDLKKELPRIPFAKDFRAFCKAGRELAKLHLNYESVEPWPLREESHGDFRVSKMKFPKKGIRHTIIYNDTCTLSEIPEEAYEYIVNGKSAIEWLMERYAVTTDKDSGIVNDPNDWCAEQGNPRYIIDLVKRIVRVSLETVRIVKNLPPLEIM